MRRIGWVFLAGCGPLGVSESVPYIGEGRFECGLRAFVQGNLEQARTELEQFLKEHPGDRRARDLLEAVIDEAGGDWQPIAEGEVPAVLDPAQLVQLVLGRNPEIREAVFRVIEARAQLRESNLSWGPRLTGIRRFTPEGAFLGLIQPLVDALWKRPVLLSRDEQRMLAACAAYAVVRVDLLARTALAVVELNEATALRKLLAEERETALEKLRVTRERVRAGILRESDLLHAESELESLRSREAAAASQAESARSRINTLLARPVHEPREISGGRVDPSFQGDLAAMIARALEWRAEPREAAYRARAAEEQGRSAAPDLLDADLRGGYGRTRTTGGTFQDGWSAEMRFGVPVLILWLVEARSGREDAFARRLFLEAERWRGQVALETAEAFHALERARAELAAARKALGWAAEERRVIEALERWGGKTDRLEVLTAGERHHRAAQEAIVRESQVQRAAVGLYRAMGIDPRFSPETAKSEGRPRALWVRRPRDAKDAEFLVDFAISRGISCLFAEIEGPEDLPRCRDLLRLARRRGIRVHALAREPSAALADGIERFNRESPPEARWDAFHAGPPPPNTPREAWLEKLKSCRRTGLRLAADLPSDWLPDAWAVVDEATVDRAPGPVPADRTGWITVPAAGKTEAQLEEECGRPDEAASGWGAAIQDYDRYRNLILGKGNEAVKIRRVAGPPAPSGPTPAPVGKKRSIPGLLPALILLLAACAVGYWSSKRRWILTTGRVVAARVQISSPFTARLKEILVVEGDRVQAGDVVARLEDDSYRAELRRNELVHEEAAARLRQLMEEGMDPAARLRLETAIGDAAERREAVRRAAAYLEGARAARDRARENAAREERLLLLKATTRARWEAATAEARMAESAAAAAEAALAEAQEAEKAAGKIVETELEALRYAERRTAAEIARLELQVRQARAAVDRARAAVESTILRAPQSGIVRRSFHRAGDVVDPNDVILEIFSPSEIWIEAYVSAAELSEIYDGQEATIELDEMPGSFRGVVRVFVPSEDPALRVGPQQARSASHLADLLHPIKVVFADLPLPDVRPERIARVRIPR